jgi:hypothetical protein
MRRTQNAETARESAFAAAMILMMAMTGSLGTFGQATTSVTLTGFLTDTSCGKRGATGNEPILSFA